MVHQVDHAAKAYVSGEDRGAKWDDLPFNQKSLIPHFYIDATHIQTKLRAGLCNVTGQTNERSMLAALIPAGHLTGHSVPTASIAECDHKAHLVWLCFANSMTGEFLLRQKITTNLSYFYLESWPLLRPAINSAAFRGLAAKAARLVSITPEIPLATPALHPRERARLRCEIDSEVAELYRLSTAEFAYIMTTFPLLDRDQPRLPSDLFVRW